MLTPSIKHILTQRKTEGAEARIKILKLAANKHYTIISKFWGPLTTLLFCHNNVSPRALLALILLIPVQKCYPIKYLSYRVQ